jgi:hypothetical protein
METELTKELKLGIWNSTHCQGVFGCFEVTIGWFGHERVDYMTYDTNEIWRCYEVKITKSDFHSKNHNTFIGNFNYYIMPQELYEQVKAEIPDGIGVYVPEDNSYRGYPELKSARRASCRELMRDEQILKNSMIRSLCREVDKQLQSGNEYRIEQIMREAKRYESQYREMSRRLTDAQTELLKIKHPEYFEEAKS